MKTSKRLHIVARDFVTKTVAALSLSVTPAFAAPFTWTQNSVATQDWTTAANWSASTVFASAPANELIFFANTTTNLANGTNAITTNVPATISMNTLTLNGRGNNLSASTSAVDIATSASTWTIGDGTISMVNLNANNNNFNGTAASGMRLDYNLAANFTLNQTTSTFTGNGSAGFQFSGNIGEAAAGYGITKTGTSALSLSGTNNYSGGSNVSGGALVFRNLISKPAAGTHAFAAGSILGFGVGDVGFFSSADIDNAFSNTMTGNLANVTRDATANIGIDTTAADFEHSTNIAGSPANGLVKLGINTLTLSGTNTYTGATTVLQGTIVAPTLANGGVASSIGAAPAGAGSLILSGGTLSYTGVTATTDRGYTHTGAANSGINVAGAAVALTVGASNSNAVEAFNITGAAGNSLTISSLTSSSTATQANLTPTIPLSLGSVTYLLPTGQFVLSNRGSAPMTVGNITGPGSTGALFLGGTTTTYTGIISGFTGNLIVGAGGQVMTFLGASTFTGIVDMRQGGTILAFNSIKNVGAGASALGAPTTVAGGTIQLGQTTNAMTLRYIGTGDTTDRVLRLHGTTGTVTLEQAGTGLLKFTSALTSGAGSKTFVLSGSTAGTGEIAGAIVNNSVTNITSLSKTGTGKWTLSGVNTYTGATTVSAGILALVGGSQTSPITVAANASLGFTLGTPNTSTSTLSFLADSKIAITGTVDNVTDYLLMTAAGGITGAPTLLTPAPGYFLQTRNSGTELWLDFNPNIQSIVIDLGAGTVIEGGTFGTYTPANPTNLPLPTFPAGTLLRSFDINTIMTATDNANFASDLTMLFDPTPGTPGGDFKLAFSSGDPSAPANPFGATHKVNWPASADGGVGTALVDSKTETAWAAAGSIDLSTHGLFLGNWYGGPVVGSTWSGTITLTYELPASGYSAWSGGALANVDTNNDGVDNGAAWVLGAANPNATATALVPTLDNTSDPDFFIFNYRRDDDANADSNTAIKAQYGSDLAGWTNATAGPNVIITPSNDFYGAGVDKVEVKIRRTLAVGGKLFTRLNVVVTP